MNSAIEPRELPVQMRWGVRIPLRDGIHLNGTLYLPARLPNPAPVIVTLQPYMTQTFHDRGMFFAGHGFPFIAVDVRGRGNSEGTFKPNIHEAKDAFDVVEWLAKQPYCDGQVTMWGGSYAGFAQWAAARGAPPHLTAIVPVAAPHLGTDFPMRANVFAPYVARWLVLVWGRTFQDRIFWNNDAFWGQTFRSWFESGRPLKELDEQLGIASEIFQEWLSHPHLGEYWDQYNPTAAEYARMSLPILSITGAYDSDQLGALTHYRKHLRHASPAARQRHFLVIGPWDHSGTRTPKADFGGIHCGPASLLDLPRLHLDWYKWTMRHGEKPGFLRDAVAYYVMGAEQWRYASSLEAVTDHFRSLYLHSTGNPVDVFSSGALAPEPQSDATPDRYVHDPKDHALAELESAVDPEDLTDQRMLLAGVGQHLVYHSAPFEQDTEVCGFFRLIVWLAIDQPDTDFRACVYRIDSRGCSILLASDWVRARYRQSLHRPVLIGTNEPLCYRFERFNFIARRIHRGERLRLTVGPVHSIFFERNTNTGGNVAEEPVGLSRPVTVKLFHDREHPSVLEVPMGSIQG